MAAGGWPPMIPGGAAVGRGSKDGDSVRVERVFVVVTRHSQAGRLQVRASAPACLLHCHVCGR
jgi:hypothetical protein